MLDIIGLGIFAAYVVGSAVTAYQVWRDTPMSPDRAKEAIRAGLIWPVRLFSKS